MTKIADRKTVTTMRLAKDLLRTYSNEALRQNRSRNSLMELVLREGAKKIHKLRGGANASVLD